jgi:TonB family protein
MNKLIKLFFTALSGLCAFSSNAQTKSDDTGTVQIYAQQAGIAPASEDAFICKWVDVEASFPGGAINWSAFLQRNLRYPEDAIDQEIQGRVTLSFIVRQDGTLSDIEAISGPELLRAEAIRVLRLSPKWIPAYQNKSPVISRQRQPISFVLEPATKPKSDLSEGLVRP